MQIKFKIHTKNEYEKCATQAQEALKNGGWNYREFKSPDEASKIDKKKDVTIFKGEVPSYGTYVVTVNIKALKEEKRGITLFAGRRNMIDQDISIARGETYTKAFYQMVCPYIPALSSERYTEKSIFVSLSGIPQSQIASGEDVEVSITATRKDVPVIWVAGDSTLTDQNAGIPYYPYGSCAGWAQILPRYIENAAVCNLAHSGMTTNCFRDDGHYAIALEHMKEGDFFIIQFGHNDQKRRNLLPYGGYADNLRRFVSEVRVKGATPIICSPISRIPLSLTEDEARELSKSSYYSLLQEYADAARDVAKELDVLFVDLHENTLKKWIDLGEEARDYFIKGDITHTNEYGAAMISDMFINDVRESTHLDAKSFLLFDDTKNYCVISPNPDDKAIPEEMPLKSPFEIEPPYLDILDVPEYEGIRKAFKYGLLDPCVMYLHPYDPMPRGQLLMVMFNALRMNGTRPYKNAFRDVKVDEWISGYVQTLLDEGYIDDDSLHKRLFRPDDPVTYGELSLFVMRTYERKEAGDSKDCNGATQKDKEYYLKRAIATGIIKKAEVKTNEIVNRADVYIILSNYMDAVKDVDGSITDDLPKDAEVHPVH